MWNQEQNSHSFRATYYELGHTYGRSDMYGQPVHLNRAAHFDRNWFICSWDAVRGF